MHLFKSDYALIALSVSHFFTSSVEVAQISNIAVGTCASPPNIAMPEAHTAPSPFGTTPTASPLSFSIMISQGAPLADHVSENASRFSDWVDGLNMLKNSQITTRDTELYVQTLTEIGLKIKLLGELCCICCVKEKKKLKIQCRIFWCRSFRREG